MACSSAATVNQPASGAAGGAEALTCLYRPCVRGRKEKRTAGGLQREGDQSKRMREKKRVLESLWRLTEGCPVQGCGSTAAGEASAGLKVESAKDVQCVKSLAERTNLLVGKKTSESLQNYTICVARLTC